MPVKRAIMLKVDERDILTFALRVDVPAGLEKPLLRYHSSYGDPGDPDTDAIRAGKVLEVFRTISSQARPGETKNQLVTRIHGEIEAKWTALQAKTSTSPRTKEVLGLYWDGADWHSNPPPYGPPLPPL